MDEKELLEVLKADVLKIVNTNMDKKAKDMYEERIIESYEYVPRNPSRSRYRRGASGSFADRENFIKEVEVNGDFIEYILTNHRETDCNCKYCRAKNGLLIDEFIEDGIAGKSRTAPKLVYENTQRDIDESEELDEVINKELKRLGW